MLKKLRARLTELLSGKKERADLTVFVLSTAALLLFIINEVLSLSGTLSTAVVNLPQILLYTRLVVWITLVAHFLAYAIISGNFLQYVKRHALELLVILGWYPQYNEGLLSHIPSFFSVEMLQLIGSLANAALVVRYFIKRFQKNPVIVTGSAFMLLVVTASGLLMQVEPETFRSWSDAGWYCIVTITTIGYGDLVPRTDLGRGIGVALMLSGIGLAGALVGIVSQTVQRKLGHVEQERQSCATAELTKQLAEQQALLRKIAEALEKDNELKQQLLDALKQRSAAGGQSGDTRTPDGS